MDDKRSPFSFLLLNKTKLAIFNSSCVCWCVFHICCLMCHNRSFVLLIIANSQILSYIFEFCKILNYVSICVLKDECVTKCARNTTLLMSFHVQCQMIRSGKTSLALNAFKRLKTRVFTMVSS